MISDELKHSEFFFFQKDVNLIKMLNKEAAMALWLERKVQTIVILFFIFELIIKAFAKISK